MGHAGAVISGDSDTAQAKLDAMEELGLAAVRNPADIGATVARVLDRGEAAPSSRAPSRVSRG
jgi:succinyl-CoA synthetase alpha subunit